MVGLTHYAIRQAASEFLPTGARALWPTEMLSSKRLPPQTANFVPEIFFYDVANGLCPQLLANEEQYIIPSVRKLESWGAVAIDINMGCPVKKALKHNYGVALMGDPAYAAEVVRTTVRAATVPVSVKLRAGFDGANTSAGQVRGETSFEDLCNFIDGLFLAGASWITIHPRSVEQKRRGNADWNLIRRLKDIWPSRMIIGNGDVQCFDDIQRMFEETGCDRVMVGRALVAKPWLIRGQAEPDLYTQGEWFGRYFLRIIDETEKYYALDAGMRRIRFFLTYVKCYLEYGEYLYGRAFASSTYPELRAAAEKFFSTKQKTVKRTMLRV